LYTQACDETPRRNAPAALRPARPLGAAQITARNALRVNPGEARRLRQKSPEAFYTSNSQVKDNTKQKTLFDFFVYNIIIAASAEF
jgi:hypothetical protein